ncbi:MAG: ATPase family associated with various cellular [Chthoniobacteraceae bacterium]|nr:ATPase family associated with various cellular [Chthoniobacteraceae bacterium]
MNPQNPQNPQSSPNPQNPLSLLEKALVATPGDWETRAYLMGHYLENHEADRAGQLLHAAPAIPDNEEAALLKAQVELEVAPGEALQTLEVILSKNRACARAYLLMAWYYQRRGLRDEARRKYGAATVIDESISDGELERWLQLSTTLPEPSDEPEQEDAVAVSAEETEAALNALFEPDEPARPQTTFDDIGGMEEVIERIRMNIIYPFKNPEIFRKFNKKSGGGILMYGPPGCGKTHIARATAGECQAAFISIAITDILSKWLGESERHLHEIFEIARRRSPTVIFIDEVDAIGVSRSDAGATVASLVNVLLTEMDGISGHNENVMILAATNAPWRIDSALRRPGRFDRVLFVPPPDLAARKAILRICLRDLPSEAVDLDKVARQTERFSGADLRAVIERASEKAIYEEMRTGRPGKLTQKSILEAVKESRPSTNEWLETARSYATYANKAGLYDDLVAFFEKS